MRLLLTAALVSTISVLAFADEPIRSEAAQRIIELSSEQMDRVVAGDARFESLRTNNTGTLELDPMLRLYDASGNLVAEDDASGG